MSEFIKVPELSGLEKAAILITELGSFNTDKVLSFLSEQEKAKLFNAVGLLGNVGIESEIRVLEEANRFGVKRGIAAPVRSDKEIAEEMNSMSGKNSKLREYINQNPDSIASALSAWMREE